MSATSLTYISDVKNGNVYFVFKCRAGTKDLFKFTNDHRVFSKPKMTSIYILNMIDDEH